MKYGAYANYEINSYGMSPTEIAMENIWLEKSVSRDTKIQHPPSEVPANHIATALDYLSGLIEKRDDFAEKDIQTKIEENIVLLREKSRESDCASQKKEQYVRLAIQLSNLYACGVTEGIDGKTLDTERLSSFIEDETQKITAHEEIIIHALNDKGLYPIITNDPRFKKIEEDNPTISDAASASNGVRREPTLPRGKKSLGKTVIRTCAQT